MADNDEELVQKIGFAIQRFNEVVERNHPLNTLAHFDTLPALC
jgi:hypothetical protein